MASLNDIALLLEHINTIDKISDEEWKSTLNDRKVKELEFIILPKICTEEHGGKMAC